MRKFAFCNAIKLLVIGFVVVICVLPNMAEAQGLVSNSNPTDKNQESPAPIPWKVDATSTEFAVADDRMPMLGVIMVFGSVLVKQEKQKRALQMLQSIYQSQRRSASSGSYSTRRQSSSASSTNRQKCNQYGRFTVYWKPTSSSRWTFDTTKYNDSRGRNGCDGAQKAIQYAKMRVRSGNAAKVVDESGAPHTHAIIWQSNGRR